MAKLAELFGWRVDDATLLEPHKDWLTCNCPFTDRVCDVSANRGDRAYFDMNGRAITDKDREIFEKYYKSDKKTPLGVCTVSTKRRFEATSKPWIVCPKRMMDLRRKAPKEGVPKILQEPPKILPEVKSLIPIKPGTNVRCWWEFKFASNEISEDIDAASRFFEFTFDYIIMEIQTSADGKTKIVGPPYILEIMTSSTRGGGLMEHMADVLALREQRRLMKPAVSSPYTPNYRQVFGRMASQLFAKSEAAEAWGGKAIWIVQDVLLEYIEQTTAFRSSYFTSNNDGNVNMVVYKLTENMHDRQYNLTYDRTLIGKSRPDDTETPSFASMLGSGYIPPLTRLISTLDTAQSKRQKDLNKANWIDFTWP